MIKKKILLAMFLMPFVLIAQEIKYNVSGTVSIDNEQVDYVYLTYLIGDNVVKDSTQVIDSKFKFSGKAPKPVVAHIYALGEKNPYYYMDDGIIYLTDQPIQVNVMESTDPYAITKKKYVITGKGEAIKVSNLLNDLLAKSAEVYKAHFKELSSKLSPEQYKQLATSPDFQRISDAYRKRNYDGFNALVKEYPSSSVLLDRFFEIIDYGQPEAEQLEVVLMRFNKDLRESETGQQHFAIINNIKSRQLGKIAPDFSLSTADGTKVSLADYRGEFVLLDFWASWCGPCRAENPNLVKLHEAKINDKKIQIIGVSIDEKSDRWLKAVEEDGLPWLQLLDAGERGDHVADRYFIRAIPQNFLIGPDGVIIAQNLRGSDIVSLVAAYIK
jgi:peroxiredoxin